MPRPKKLVEAPARLTHAVSYMGNPAIIIHTHEDGSLDLAVDYSGKIVTKIRVSPDSVEYKNAP